LAFLYGLHRIGLGIDLSDEGMYLAAPTRYALGDIPFRHEFLNPHRMFDIVLWPLFQLLPDISLHQLRLLWLVVQTAAAMSLYGVFRRFAPNLILAVAGVGTLYISNITWTPGYHLMGTFLFVLAWSLWLTACLSRSRASQIGLGGASGLVFFVGALSYLPLLAVQIVPACVLAAGARRGMANKARMVATAAHVLSLLLLSLAAVAIVAHHGLVADWMNAHTTSLESRLYATTVPQKISIFLAQTAMHLPTVLAVAALIGFLLSCCHDWKPLARFTGSASGIAVLAFAAASVISIFALDVVPVANASRLGKLFSALPLRFVAIALGLHLGALLSIASLRRRKDDPDWWLVYFATLGGSFILAFLHGVLSGMAFKAMFALLPLFMSAVVVVYRAMLSVATSPRAGVRAVILTASICLPLVAGAFSVVSKRSSYGEYPLSRLTAEFSQPRLAGIWSEPEKVAHLDAVSSYLSESVEEGEFLLIAGHAPLLYYLTRTRPALDHSWTAAAISPRVKRRSVRWMIEQDRVPRYAVVYRALAPSRAALATQRGKQRHPIHSFILKHYTQEHTFGPFEVWTLSVAGAD
jgi:hypothetical protein